MPSKTYKMKKGLIDFLLEKYYGLNRGDLKQSMGLDFKTLKKINDGGPVSAKIIDKLESFFGLVPWEILGEGDLNDNDKKSISTSVYYKADNITNNDLELRPLYVKENLLHLTDYCNLSNQTRWIFEKNLKLDSDTSEIIKSIDDNLIKYKDMYLKYNNLQADIEKIPDIGDEMIQDNIFKNYDINSQFSILEAKPNDLALNPLFLEDIRTSLIEKNIFIYFVLYKFWNSRCYEDYPIDNWITEFSSTPILTLFVANRYYRYLEVNAGHNYVNNQSEIKDMILERGMSIMVDGVLFTEQDFDWS